MEISLQNANSGLHLFARAWRFPSTPHHFHTLHLSIVSALQKANCSFSANRLPVCFCTCRLHSRPIVSPGRVHSLPIKGSGNWSKGGPIKGRLNRRPNGEDIANGYLEGRGRGRRRENAAPNGWRRLKKCDELGNWWEKVVCKRKRLKPKNANEEN